MLSLMNLEQMAPRQWAELKNCFQTSDIILVPFAGAIKNNEVVKIECVDWTGTSIGFTLFEKFTKGCLKADRLRTMTARTTSRTWI